MKIFFAATCLSSLLDPRSSVNGWVIMPRWWYISGTVNHIVLPIISQEVTSVSSIYGCFLFCCCRAFTGSWWRFSMRMIIHPCLQRAPPNLLFSVRYDAFINTFTQICTYTILQPYKVFLCYLSVSVLSSWFQLILWYSLSKPQMPIMTISFTQLTSHL